jgi:hypothetical protein
MFADNDVSSRAAANFAVNLTTGIIMASLSQSKPAAFQHNFNL